MDSGEAVLIWTPGRVARVADGLTDKRSARARKILPAGALLWEWEANEEFGEKAGEQWLILLPDKWNRQVHYGWRFSPTQLREDKERAATASASDMQDNATAHPESSDATNPRPRKQRKQK